jgi:hypothetical protein
VLLATEGPLAGVDHLLMYNICAENLQHLVQDPEGKIKQVETSNVVILPK